MRSNSLTHAPWTGEPKKRTQLARAQTLGIGLRARKPFAGPTLTAKQCERP